MSTHTPELTMVDPTPTASDKQVKRDGRLLTFMMGAVARLDFPGHGDIKIAGPTIAAGNHQSLLDVFCAAAFCYQADVSCRFLVQARYFENRLAGRWLRRIGCIALNADNKDEAFAEAKASLARGELIGIMPEGRLTKPEDRDPQVGRGRTGVAELAREAGATVRPISFHQSGLAWPRGQWPRITRRRPVVTMRLGGPIDLSGSDDQADADAVMAALTALLNDLDAKSTG